MSLRAALLGAGNMAKRHAPSLHALGVEVAAVCDLNPDAIASFQQTVNIPGIKEYHDFDEMLQDCPFDLLFILLPPFAQRGQFQQAAALGKHIFIEKPIALDTRTGKQMVDAAQEHGIVSYVGFHMRKGGAVVRLVELIESGKTGRPVLFNGQYQCNSLHTPWWIKADLSGGQIFEQAIHVYDMCRYLMGDPKFASGIMANVCHNHMREYTVEDVSASIAGFTGGAVASITANNCSIPGVWTGKFTATYEKVTAEFEDCNRARFFYTGGDEVTCEQVDADNDPSLDEVREFVECAAAGRPTSCDITEGYKSLCYVETVVRSAKVDGQKLEVAGL